MRLSLLLVNRYITAYRFSHIHHANCFARIQEKKRSHTGKLALYLGCSPLLSSSKFSAEQASTECRSESCHFEKDRVLAPQHISNCGVGGGPQRGHDMIRDVFAHMFRSAHLPTRQEVRAELSGCLTRARGTL